MTVAVVKYNAGNIYSVLSVLQRLGVEPVLTDDPKILHQADKVIFPGQGEASNAMQYLRERGLDEVIRSLTQPVLGICIGQQLMCRHSAEGDVDCLGIFDTDVVRFFPEKHEDKVPHMGWNELNALKSPLSAFRTSGWTLCIGNASPCSAHPSIHTFLASWRTGRTVRIHQFLYLVSQRSCRLDGLFRTNCSQRL